MRVQTLLNYLMTESLALPRQALRIVIGHEWTEIMAKNPSDTSLSRRILSLGRHPSSSCTVNLFLLLNCAEKSLYSFDFASLGLPWALIRLLLSGQILYEV